MTVYVWCDGSIQGGNPGGWAVGGWLAKDEDGEVFNRGCIDLKKEPWNTNNMAEYSAVWAALATLVRDGQAGEHLVVHSDSKLIVNQLLGVYQVSNPTLKAFCEIVHRLEVEFLSVTYQWIPREQNEEADAQSRRLYADSPD
jgi:ribonuclease HI